MTGGIRAMALTSQLLRDAAQFFLAVGQQNPELRAQMAENADVYRLVADRLDENPDDVLSVADEDGAASVVAVAIRLLRDAAVFFRNVGAQNPEFADRMAENADVYDVLSDLIESDPAACLPADA